MELNKHHKRYLLTSTNEEPWLYRYSAGEIENTQMLLEKDNPEKMVIVRYRSGETYTWNSKYFSSYIDQFGIAVSADGTKLFAQTWDNGLFCFDAKTGERIWRTKSRRGITNIFVNDDTITVQLHDYAMQLVDIHTGEVLKEKRPSTAWGFTSLNHQYLICHSTARRWEIIEAETLAVKESFSHKEFTNDHTEFCVRDICLCENGTICVKGFQTVWDESQKPPKMLPSIEFEHSLITKTFQK